MIGLRILERTRAVAPASARRLLDIPVANVSDCMSRMFAGGPRLRHMHAGGVMHDAAVGKMAYEKKKMEDIRVGTNDTRWVDATLRRLGCALPG